MNQLLNLLSDTKYSAIIEKVEEVTINDYTVPNLFKITSKGLLT